MSSEKDYDELLYPILCSEGNIVGFFDRVFDFLYRRTDFFRVKTTDLSSLGLAPGEAENVVKNAFVAYMKRSVDIAKNVESGTDDPDVLEYVSEEIVETTVTSESKQNAVRNTEKTSKKSQLNNSVEDRVGTKENETDNGKEKKIEEINTNKKKEKETDNQIKTDKEIDKKQQSMDPESYNGAQYDGYSWSQSLGELDLLIKVPEEISTGRHVHIKIQQTHICAEILLNGVWTVVKDGDLTWKINIEESTWTLVPHEHIHIQLQKLQDRWWNALFVDEPKIDTKAIDASIPYEDLDEGSRAKIQELMFNEHQKRLGKPTVEQLKIQDALKEAWDIEGSPFKGQPYDPSIINIQDNGSLS